MFQLFVVWFVDVR